MTDRTPSLDRPDAGPPVSHGTRTGTKPSTLRVLTALLLVPAFLAAGARAADAGAWDWSVSAGSVMQNVYPGSRDAFVIPFASVSATVTRGDLVTTASLLDGLNLTYVRPGAPIVASLALQYGTERFRTHYSRFGFDADHSATTQRLLEGSPNLSNPLVAQFTLAYRTPFALIGATLGYHPTSIDPVDASEDDHLEHALVYGLQILTGAPLSRAWSLQAMGAVEFMDQDYADTWYSATTANSVHGTHDAGAGVRDAQFAAQLQYAYSANVSFAALIGHTVLLGDAASSPFTTARHQTTVLAQGTYDF